MEDGSKAYLPAAGHYWTLPLYDPFVNLLGGDKARKLLLDQAAGQSIRRVLDVGCGTGTLVAMMTKRLDPGVEIVGLDPDPRALPELGEKRNKKGCPPSSIKAIQKHCPILQRPLIECSRHSCFTISGLTRGKGR